MKRRTVLAGLGGAFLAPKFAYATTSQTELVATPATIQLLPDAYPQTEVWGFNGSVPGPEIRLRQGERVLRSLRNELSQPTAVHWHGLRIPNAMDGVPGMTQEPVLPGQSFAYDFTPPDAGTFWYHSHNQSTEQIARGLFGLLIVDEQEPPAVDHDIAVALSDWRVGQNGAISNDFGAMHDWTHAGRIGNFVKAHLSPEVGALKQHQRLRLRLVNVATDRIMVIGLHGLEGAIVALDGMPLAQPDRTDHVVLGPAQRADFIADVTAAQGEPAIIALHEREGAFVLAEIPVTGAAARGPQGAIAPLPPNPLVPLSTITEAQVARLIMEGGAMGRLSQGIYKGERMTIDELVQQGQIWTFNGVAGLPEKPLAVLDRGEVLRIPMRNDTVFPHAMHLHGHHFQEVLADGTLGPLRDTILIDAGETREIAFRADNPGDWLLHCHMLSHQASGMKTWLRVRA